MDMSFFETKIEESRKEIEEGLKTGKYFKDRHGMVHYKEKMEPWEPKNGTFGWRLFDIDVEGADEKELEDFLRAMLLKTLLYHPSSVVEGPDGPHGLMPPWDRLKSSIERKNLLEEFIELLDDTLHLRFNIIEIYKSKAEDKERDPFYSWVSDSRRDLIELLREIDKSIKEMLF